MSKLGFDRAIRNMASAEKDFLRGAMKLAQKEFSDNFNTESDAEQRSSWEKVKRKVPPQILVETGRLRKETVSGRPKLLFNTITLIVDPVDRKGRNYASYHEDGDGRVAKRAYITQSSNLTREQESLLDSLFIRSL